MTYYSRIFVDSVSQKYLLILKTKRMFLRTSPHSWAPRLTSKGGAIVKVKLEKKDGYSEDAKQCDFLPDPNTLRLLALPFSLLKALLHAEEKET